MTTRILLADDDLDDQGLFLDALQQIDAGVTLLTAVNGIDALLQLRQQQQLPDLVFLDLNMPLMNGMQCLREIRKDEALQHIPVVIYSTSSYQRDIDTARNAGAADYLVKPFSFSGLCDNIRNILEKHYQHV